MRCRTLKYCAQFVAQPKVEHQALADLIVILHEQADVLLPERASKAASRQPAAARCPDYEIGQRTYPGHQTAEDHHSGMSLRRALSLAYYSRLNSRLDRMSSSNESQRIRQVEVAHREREWV